jgi:RNA polymerase sigma factor (sigma-70 family)
MSADRVRLRLDGSAEALVRLLHDVIARFTPGLCGRVVSAREAQFNLYLRRVQFCVEYHAARLGESEPAQVVERLERGELGARVLQGNLVREVLLAQALELREPTAAQVFEAEYMPVVRSMARHLGGDRAADAVENFAAELLLPRDGRLPRIATYQGRTTLRQWLAAVVANVWRTELRRSRPSVPAGFEPDGRDRLIKGRRSGADAAAEPPVDFRQCEELLRPIFQAAGRLLEAEDRLLLQMLLLDGVPQKALARGLGLSSGTITRRRQRAIETILVGTRRLMAQSERSHQADACLELVIAGDDTELRRSLGEVLAAGIRAAGACCGAAGASGERPHDG